MKKQLRTLFLFAVLVSIFSSCSKDDKLAHPIVGTWKLVSESASNCTDPLDDYEDTYVCTATDCITITFKNNGKFTIKEIDDDDVDTEQGTYTIAGNEITLCYPDIPPDCEYPMTFAINGATLTFTSVDNFDGCTNTIVFKK